jgi:hypothetical protein
LINLLLQDRGYQILRALLREQTLGLLAVSVVEVVWILALVSVSVFTADQCHQRQNKQCNFHMPSFSKNASMTRLAMSGGKNCNTLKPTQIKAR